MKAQFKYTFQTELHARGYMFTVIFAINLVFILFGSLDLLPEAALITAVSLGGVAIAAMAALNLARDVAVVRRMFASPEAYLSMLIPEPRRKTLLSSVLVMLIMDISTMAVVIAAEVWLAFILSGDDFLRVIWEAFRANFPELLFGLWYVALLIAGYLLVLMIALFSAAARKSFFYGKPAGGLMTAALAVAVAYAVSLSQLVLAAFGTVSRYGFFFTVTLHSRMGFVLFVFLVLLEAAALFVITSKLMERKINI